MQRGSFVFKAKKTKIAVHQEISDNAFSLFHKTVADLHTANTSIEKDIAIEDEIIVQANIARIALVNIREVNLKFANKIKDFFEI